jgi:hypothetical protein
MMLAALLFERVCPRGAGRRGRIAVARELADVTYTPRDPPYVPHADTTGYIEKCEGTGPSMCGLLVAEYKSEYGRGPERGGDGA